MFDVTYRDTQDLPTTHTCRLMKRGAVASCFFPLAEAPNKPGPAARPALVVRVFRDRTDGQWKALVAYGTSRGSSANRGHEVRITRADSITHAGLDKPTRFTLTRMRILPIDREFFSHGPGGSPVLGYLDDDLVEHLARTCERIVMLAPELCPFLIPTNIGVITDPKPYPAGGDTADLAGHVLRTEPCDDLLQECFIGRSNLAKRLSRRRTPMVDPSCYRLV